jgi:hypothetical protein
MKRRQMIVAMRKEGFMLVRLDRLEREERRRGE